MMPMSMPMPMPMPMPMVRRLPAPATPREFARITTRLDLSPSFIDAQGRQAARTPGR